MANDMIYRDKALEAIAEAQEVNLADTNHNYLMGFQDAAEAVQNCPDVWKDPEQEVPADGILVLALINAKHDRVTYILSPVIAEYCRSDGWYVDGLPKDIKYTVRRWMEIPERREEQK